jgi:hypothetical protein
MNEGCKADPWFKTSCWNISYAFWSNGIEIIQLSSSRILHKKIATTNHLLHRTSLNSNLLETHQDQFLCSFKKPNKKILIFYLIKGKKTKGSISLLFGNSDYYYKKNVNIIWFWISKQLLKIPCNYKSCVRRRKKGNTLAICERLNWKNGEWKMWGWWKRIEWVLNRIIRKMEQTKTKQNKTEKNNDWFYRREQREKTIYMLCLNGCIYGTKSFSFLFGGSHKCM